jgi:hypothetical protein
MYGATGICQVISDTSPSELFADWLSIRLHLIYASISEGVEVTNPRPV